MNTSDKIKLTAEIASRLISVKPEITEETRLSSIHDLVLKNEEIELVKADRKKCSLSRFTS